jgi:hypothetical protein
MLHAGRPLELVLAVGASVALMVMMGLSARSKDSKREH